jgi:hypothetical protein
MASIRRTVDAGPGMMRYGPLAHWQRRSAAEQGSSRSSTAGVKTGSAPGENPEARAFGNLIYHPINHWFTPRLVQPGGNPIELRYSDFLTFPVRRKTPISAAPTALPHRSSPPRFRTKSPTSSGQPPTWFATVSPVTSPVHPYNQPCTPGSPSVRSPCAPHLSPCPVCPRPSPKSNAGLPACPPR